MPTCSMAGYAKLSKFYPSTHSMFASFRNLHIGEPHVRASSVLDVEMDIAQRL